MGWRAAHIDELSPAFLEWIRDHGADTSGHIIGDFSDAESKTDSAYLLVRGDQRRVVLLVQGRDCYDYAYSQLAGMARVPQDSLQDIQWRIEPQARPKSSALMLVTDTENPASGVVIFSLGNRVYTGVPKDYRTVQLK